MGDYIYRIHPLDSFLANTADTSNAHGGGAGLDLPPRATTTPHSTQQREGGDHERLAE